MKHEEEEVVVVVDKSPEESKAVEHPRVAVAVDYNPLFATNILSLVNSSHEPVSHRPYQHFQHSKMYSDCSAHVDDEPNKNEVMQHHHPVDRR